MLLLNLHLLSKLFGIPPFILTVKLHKLEFIEYPRDEANLRKLAVEIIKDFEANRANKRSFGVSNNRFIPPHQYFAAQNYLKHF